MYITIEAIPIAKQVELINKYKFVKVALDKNSGIFIIHVTALEALAKMTIHFFWAI